MVHTRLHGGVILRAAAGIRAVVFKSFELSGIAHKIGFLKILDGAICGGLAAADKVGALVRLLKRGVGRLENFRGR